MIEISEENKVPASELVVQLSPQDSQYQSKSTHVHRKKTGGEVVFDRTVYTGIGFFLNEGLSLYLADEFRAGWGKPGFEWLADKASRFFKDATKNNKFYTARQSAYNSLTTLALLTGGTLFVAPMKLLEDHKDHWVRQANHLLDKLNAKHLSEEQRQKRDAEVSEVIACEPKQSWGTLVFGRLLAVATTLSFGTFVMGPHRNGKVEAFTENHGVLLGKKFHAATGGDPRSLIGKIVNSERFPRYNRLLGIETIYTAISSIVLEISSKFLASKKPLVKNPELCEASNEVAPAITDNSSQTEKISKYSAPNTSKQKAFTSHAQRIVAESTQPLQPSPSL